MCGFVGFIDKNNIETKKIALENMMIQHEVGATHHAPEAHANSR